MVRLKSFEVLFVDFIYFLFQFHYGSIKIPAVSAQYVFFTVFQFHYGSIKMARATSEPP